jgi:predicted cupin superfamily sugar epimerase
LIEQYGLEPHPEGRWYTEAYNSENGVLSNALPERFSGYRAFYTAIYFLLEPGNFSAFHRIRSDEYWHFYTGDPLLVYSIFPSGKLEVIKLGNDFSGGELFQYLVLPIAGLRAGQLPAAAFLLCVVPFLRVLNSRILSWQMPPHCKNMPSTCNIINELCR